MNDRSSRSHSLFVVWMQRQEPVPAAAGSTTSQRREISARINLVDLAGSERMTKSGAKGETMKEGININQVHAPRAPRPTTHAPRPTTRAPPPHRPTAPPPHRPAPHAPRPIHMHMHMHMCMHMHMHMHMCM